MEPLSSLLAAFAKHSSAIYVFDTISNRRAELQSPHNIVGLHWSPTGEYLFVATEYVGLAWLVCRTGILVSTVAKTVLMSGGTCRSCGRR